MARVLKHIIYKDNLRDTGLFCSRKRKLKEKLISTFNYLMFMEPYASWRFTAK